MRLTSLVSVYLGPSLRQPTINSSVASIVRDPYEIMSLTHEATIFIIVVTVLSGLATSFSIARFVMRRRAILGSDGYVLMFANVALVNILGGVGKLFLTLTPDEVTWLLKV
ncbi:hypothetical protein NUW58_g3229 [Xylaria curta]|uniref:Uncharacterized protein n=1 Tax=Xylaria curta TaxID=42375 RepID=A0ACC1PBV9_9PEZI|nr:hypothetical protein NUW58_g3229 [Xylaria curta]